MSHSEQQGGREGGKKGECVYSSQSLCEMYMKYTLCLGEVFPFDLISIMCLVNCCTVDNTHCLHLSVMSEVCGCQ